MRKRLIPFIQEHHRRDKIVFWSDLVSSHYSKGTQAYLKAQNVTCVSKLDNPASVPGARSIEDFWSILKGIVYEKGWQADNLEQRRNRIKYCIEKVGIKLVQRLIASTKSRLDIIRRYDVIENRK
jgi:hypothetical protein